MSIKINGLISEFIDSVCAGKTNETAAAYRTKLAYLSRYLGDGEITQDAINSFKQNLLTRKSKMRGKSEVNAGLSLFTVRSVISTIRHFLRWGSDRFYWPSINLINIQEPLPQPKAIDQTTFERLVKAAVVTGQEWEQVRNTAILFVLRDSGCRVGALASIDISNVDLDDHVISAMDKGSQMNWIYLTTPSVDAIRDWIGVRETLDPWDYKLWTGQRHRGLKREGIQRMIIRLAEAEGIRGVRYNPHSFRHAFARDALKAGADLSQVSQMLHHKSIVVTAKYYARWADSELRETHQRVSPLNKMHTTG